MDYGLLAFSLASFAFITLAAFQIGQLATRFHLPLISGYLLSGMLAGPFILQFMDVTSVESLRFLDEVSLAFIAFAAGSEMALDELRGRYRSIGWNTLTQIASIYLFCGAAVFLLADYIPFMQGMSTLGKVSVSLLASTILAARSPSSAIAIINEMRARGPFTKGVLGVTLVKDVVIVVLFAFSTSVAATLLTGHQFDLGFILLVAFEILASIGFGILVAQLMALILRNHWEDGVKIPLILLIGYLVFAVSGEIRHFSHENLPVELLFEPLLICMVASFWLTKSQSLSQRIASPAASGRDANLCHLLHADRSSAGFECAGRAPADHAGLVRRALAGAICRRLYRRVARWRSGANQSAHLDGLYHPGWGRLGLGQRSCD